MHLHNEYRPAHGRHRTEGWEICMSHKTVWLLCHPQLKQLKRMDFSEGWGGQMLLVDFCFYYFALLGRGLPPSSQINHTERLFLIYKYPALAWLISYQLF